MHRIVVVGGRAAHHVPVHVAAGPQGAELDLVDPPNGLLQAPLQDAVQLQPLAGRDPQGGIPQFVTQIELGQQLLGRQPSPRNLGADHHAVRFAPPVGPRGRPLVAIVLLVGAVMFQQLDAALAEKGVVVDQFLGNLPPQIMAGRLKRFHRARFVVFAHNLGAASR